MRGWLTARGALWTRRVHLLRMEATKVRSASSASGKDRVANTFRLGELESWDF
jgi:hypothetical protein